MQPVVSTIQWQSLNEEFLLSSTRDLDLIQPGLNWRHNRRLNNQKCNSSHNWIQIHWKWLKKDATTKVRALMLLLGWMTRRKNMTCDRCKRDIKRRTTSLWVARSTLKSSAAPLWRVTHSRTAVILFKAQWTIIWVITITRKEVMTVRFRVIRCIICQRIPVTHQI